MQAEIRGTRGLSIREDSVEDLVIEGKEGGARPEVVGACLGTYIFKCTVLLSDISCTYSNT